MFNFNLKDEVFTTKAGKIHKGTVIKKVTTEVLNDDGTEGVSCIVNLTGFDRAIDGNNIYTDLDSLKNDLLAKLFPDA